MGDVNILGDALLEFGSGAVSGVTSGTKVSIRDDPTALSFNAGSNTTGTFSNAGTLDVDNQIPPAQAGDGGSTLAIGATLSNSGTVNIGNTSLSAATTVTATGLANTGTINIAGGIHNSRCCRSVVQSPTREQ